MVVGGALRMWVKSFTVRKTEEQGVCSLVDTLSDHCCHDLTMELGFVMHCISYYLKLHN